MRLNPRQQADQREYMKAWGGEILTVKTKTYKNQEAPPPTPTSTDKVNNILHPILAIFWWLIAGFIIAKLIIGLGNYVSHIFGG